MKKTDLYINNLRKENLIKLTGEILLKTNGKINVTHIKESLKDIDLFENYKIEVVTKAKEFNEYCCLRNYSNEHSWAGEEGEKETGTVLYGPNVEFGENIDTSYSNNGNITDEERCIINSNFDINSIHIVLIESNSWDTYNNAHINDFEYKIIVYLPDNNPYELDEKTIKILKILEGE